MQSLDSTQTTLKQRENLKEGDCLQALSQQNGQGRHGRIWSSPKGNLYCSCVLQPNCPSERIGEIALLIGLAIAESCNTATNPTLKWPNDILLNGKKCAGILIETTDMQAGHINTVVIGFGVNYEHKAHEQGTTLKQHQTSHESLDEVRDAILSNISRYYKYWQTCGFAEIRKAWLGYAMPISTSMSVKIDENHISGQFEGIDKAGHLLLLCDKSSKLKTISSGDVFLHDTTCD